MRNRPSLIKPKLDIQTNNNLVPSTQSQHGSDYLCQIPFETLTHITSYLTPPSLLALSLTNRHLHSHIQDERTWRKAAMYHFLGIDPEDDGRNRGATLMIRRMESTWRREFIHRYKLMSRWQNSLTTSIAHIPHRTPVSSMLLLSDGVSLLSSSIEHGLVYRSAPFTGKVFKGTLRPDGARTTDLQGFLEDAISAIGVAANGHTARVIWGNVSGNVGLTVAKRVMNSSGSDFVRSDMHSKHLAAIEHVGWCHARATDGRFVTGGADGLVKLWEPLGPHALRCLWTSESPQPLDMINRNIERDAVVKIAFEGDHESIAAGFRSGTVAIWFKLEEQYSEIRVPPADTDLNYQPPTILLIYSVSSSFITLLVHHESQPYFYRIDVHVHDRSVTRIKYSDGPLGSLTVIHPDLLQASPPAALQGPLHDPQSSFILGGDTVGRVCVWEWNAYDPRDSSSMRRWEAHEQDISAIQCNGLVIVTGSGTGSVKVWDALSLALLRSIRAPIPNREPVRQIIVGREFVIYSLGCYVIAWHANPAFSRKGERERKVGSRAPSGKTSRTAASAKWHEQTELKRDLVESQLEMAQERKIKQYSYTREKSWHSSLDKLGLNEAEALEYALMLSRDEERNSTDLSQHTLQEVFDDHHSPASSTATSSSRPPNDVSIPEQRDISHAKTGSGLSFTTRSTPIPPRSLKTTGSPLSITANSTPSPRRSSSRSPPTDFPPINPAKLSSPKKTLASLHDKKTIPQYSRIASSPINRGTLEPRRSSPLISSSTRPPPSQQISNMSEEDQLKYAMALSLADAGNQPKTTR